MKFRIILSQPAGGKTSFCISIIRELRKKQPLAAVKVIVPDKMQMSYWKQTLANDPAPKGQINGFIGTQIISFAKLAIEILRSAPENPRLIPSRLDSLCIREAVTLASKKQPLEYFGPILEKPGLPSVFESTIKTLLHQRISPEMLEKAADGDAKAADTSRVFQEYLALLKENNWTGSAELLNAAAEAVEMNRANILHCPLLVIDGFDELSQDQLNLLRVISPYCDEILLTLPAHPDSDNLTDQRICEQAENICNELNGEFEYPAIEKNDSDILELADHVFYPDKKGEKLTNKSNGLLMIEASSRTTEVREALRELKRRITGQKLSPMDCAVFVPDMAAYAPILRQFGREMGIPLRFSQKPALSESPAASALKRLLHLAPDFETVHLLPVLRLPFFSGCPDPENQAGSYQEDLFVIDRIGRKENVISGIDEWKAAFDFVINNSDERKNNDDVNNTDEGKIYEYPPREKIIRIRSSFLKLAELITPPDGTMYRANWVKWLENLLETIHFYDQIEDQKGRSFESDFKAMLKRIVFCEEKLSQKPVPYSDFLTELESEIESTIQTEQEYAADRIFVGDISQTSGCRWKLIILTGFAEGIFPRAEHEDLILTNELRKKLALPQKTDQQLLFHHAITRSGTGLIITRPTKTDKGEEWPASIFWQAICQNLENEENLLTVSENMPVIPASMNELAFNLARNDQKSVHPEVPQPEAEKLQKLLDDAQQQMLVMKDQSEGRYSPVPDPALEKALSDPARDSVPYSCSAIETWLSCPFRYFLSGKLKLEQQLQPGTGMDAAQIGSLYHKVMELTFTPGTVYNSKEEAMEKANKNIDIVFATAPQEFKFRESELWEFEKEKYRQKLLDSIEKMFSDRKMPMNSQWQSIGAEMKFGYPEKGKTNTEPLEIETEAGPIQIRGIIDRVDRRDDGLLRVVDYKTGLSGFSTRELEAGSHIQAGIYSAAAVHALKLGTHCEGMYWSINDKSIKHITSYDSEKDGNIPNIEFLNKFAVGMRDAEFPAMIAGVSCPDYCPAVSWCKKYVRRENYG